MMSVDDLPARSFQAQCVEATLNMNDLHTSSHVLTLEAMTRA